MFATRYLCFAAKMRTASVNFEALTAFKSIYGHLKVPQKFKIPENNDAWPKTLAGWNLGQHVADVRVDMKRSHYSSEVVKRLNELGFIQDVRVYRSQCTLLAFQTFVKKFGHGNVPLGFAIEKDDLSWPRETRGFKLGLMLVNIRCGYYANIKDELRSLGVTVDNIVQPPDFERFFAALKIYKSDHGHVKVPSNYVVPFENLKLGSWLHNIRVSNNFAQHKHRLEALGVDYKLIRHPLYTEEEVVQTVNAYKSIYGHLTITAPFVVPTNDSRFPASMWGVKLGGNMRRWKNWKTLKAMGVTITTVAVNKVEVK